MKILVIGVNGQVGRELMSALNCLTLEGGHRPHLVFCNRNDLDLARLQATTEYLNVIAPNIIVNAAAYTAVDQAESHSELAYLINEAAVKEMALFCRKRQCCLIHISTDYVFDGWSDRPYVESDTVCPSGVYGCSKLAGEKAIREVLDEHIILRTSWVFGAGGNNFVKTMLRLAANKKVLRVVADQCGAPTSARAIADTIAIIIGRLASEPEPGHLWGTYHFSGFPFVSWAEFAKEIFEQATYRGLMPAPAQVDEINTTDYPTPAVRPANSRLDCSKLKGTFGVEPDDWKRSLGLMLEELKVGMLT